MSNLYHAKITTDSRQEKNCVIESADTKKGFCGITLTESELVEIHNALSYMVFTTDARAMLLQSSENKITDVLFYCAKLEEIRSKIEYLIKA